MHTTDLISVTRIAMADDATDAQREYARTLAPLIAATLTTTQMDAYNSWRSRRSLLPVRLIKGKLVTPTHINGVRV